MTFQQLSEFADRLSQFGFVLPLGFVVFMIMAGLNKAAQKFQWPWMQKITKYLAYIAWGSAALVILGAFVFVSIVIFTVFRGNN